MESNFTHIYALVDPRNDQPKYIGKADNTEKRFKKHLSDNENTKKNNWIKSLQRCGLLPLLEIIDIVNKLEWEFWEQHYISLYRSWGFDLKNMTIGGDGCHLTKQRNPHSEETKRKIGLSSLGRVKTEEAIRKITAASTGRKKSEETRKKISIARQGIIFSEEHRRNLSISRIQGITPEFRQKKRELRLKQKDPRLGKKHTSETKALMSQLSKERYAKKLNNT